MVASAFGLPLQKTRGYPEAMAQPKTSFNPSEYPRINKPLVDFDWGVSPFGDSDHFWREHPQMKETDGFYLDPGSTVGHLGP